MSNENASGMKKGEFIEKVFSSHPHVDTIWWKPGNVFNLHPDAGGEEIHRGRFVDDEVVNNADQEVINAINKANTIDDVDALAENSDHAMVAKAAKERKVLLRSKTGKEESKLIEQIKACTDEEQVNAIIRGQTTEAVVRAGNDKITELKNGNKPKK